MTSSFLGSLRDDEAYKRRLIQLMVAITATFFVAVGAVILSFAIQLPFQYGLAVILPLPLLVLAYSGIVTGEVLLHFRHVLRGEPARFFGFVMAGCYVVAVVAIFGIFSI